MKKWKEVSPYTGESVEMEEDAPVNSVAGGGVSMPPDALKKKRSLIDARTKSYKDHRSKLKAQRIRRQESRRKSSIIGEQLEKIDNLFEYAGAGYDKVAPMADLNASKSSTGYELYHKTFSGAMQHAYKFAKSKGYIVDKSDIDNKVATGPKKPSSGKTNSYTLGTNKKQKVQIQVANLDNKRYELNMYIS